MEDPVWQVRKLGFDKIINILEGDYFISPKDIRTIMRETGNLMENIVEGELSINEWEIKLELGAER